MNAHFPFIAGSKGGSGKSGASSANTSGGVESSNTLRSASIARIVELLGEGEIEGLVNGAQSIFFDRTPVQNSDGTLNFASRVNQTISETSKSGTTSSYEVTTIGADGIGYSFRSGLPDQPYIEGFPQAETPHQVEVQVRNSVTPTVKTITDTAADSVRVVVRIPALAQQDKQGNLLPASLSYIIEVRAAGGPWQTAVQADLYSQKCTSPYQRSHRVPLPHNGYPWDIRVRRLTADSTQTTLQNDLYWESFTTVVEGKFIYPNSAIVALTIDARQFGSSIPARSYEVKGLKIQVPTNYNPVTRQYSGIWDGTFKTAWTNNPAWVLYDLITNDRYGLGEFVDGAKVDKWSLYQVAQYCDAQVPSGFNDVNGNPILEPRFTYNGVINNREEAYKVLQGVTSAFRGMAYWSLGQVFAVADMPQDPVKLVAPANVIGGHFSYSGTAMKARHSVALVSWNDPQDFYSEAIEVVQNNTLMQRFGWRETAVQAVGCTSRGQAHRYGKWILDTEENETELVEYEASWDQADLRPGDIVLIADPRKAQVRTGGRLVASNGSAPGDHASYVFTLDAPFVPQMGETYTFLVVGVDGEIHSAPITAFDGTNTIVTTLGMPVTPLPGAMWVIQGTDVSPRRFRIMSISESAEHTFKITALFNDPTKYARVEQGIQLAPVRYQRPKTTIAEPTNLHAVESLYFQSGVAHSRISLSWTPSDDFLAAGYLVSAMTPQGFVNYGQVSATSIDISDTSRGDYTFYVSSVALSGLASTPASIEFTASGWEGVDGPFVSHLEIFGRGSDPTFGGRDVRFVWRNNFPGTTYEIGDEEYGAGAGYYNPFYRDNVVRIFDTETGDLLRTEVVTTESFAYSYDHNAQDNAPLLRGAQRKFRIEVSVRDRLGRESSPAKLVASNPVPDLVIPVPQAGQELIFVSYTTPNDLDTAGAMIWLSPDEHFDPLTTDPIYDGVSNFVSFPVEPLTTYYVRMACYDAFDKVGLNISPAIPVISGILVDRDPPDVPVGLTAFAELAVADDGTLQSKLTVTWSANGSDNYSYDELDIRVKGTSSWIAYPAPGGRYELRGLAFNTIYELRLRAVSKAGYASIYGDTIEVTIPANSATPAAVTALAGLSSLKSVFLTWTNPSDRDLDHIEIWSATANDRSTATLIGTSTGTAFTHSGLTTGVARFYWVRAVNTSNLVGVFNTAANAGVSVTPGQVASGDIAANAVIADKILAGVITGDKLNINTQLPATITVGTSGVSIGSMTDPVALANLGTTKILPGLVQISGATTLASWRNGSDQTKIEGGAVAANTIDANKLTIGNRALSIIGVQFTYDKTTNVLSWSAGAITYPNDAGNAQTDTINAGFTSAWTSGTIYVFWTRGSSTLSFDTTPPTGANSVVFATYRGSNDLVATYGRTIIDGANILSNTITAQQIAAQTITGAQIAANSITATHIQAGQVTADKIGAGTISASSAIKLGGDRFILSASSQQQLIFDGQAINSGAGRLRVLIGALGAGPTDYGLGVWDQDGNYLFGSGGFGASVIPRSALTGFGALADINGITAANASTYIAAAAITDAMILNLSASKISASSLSAISANIGIVTAGVMQSAALSSDGSGQPRMVLNLNAGSFVIRD